MDFRYEDLSVLFDTVAEDEADYIVAPHGSPAPPARQVTGTGIRLLSEIRSGKALDDARRSSGSTARDAGQPAFGQDDVAAADDDAVALSDRLHLLARARDCDLAEQLSLLLCFDALEGWRAAGCSSCIAWMNEYLGIARTTAYERLSVARELESLPLLRALFRVGRLSWSKIRLLVRVADADTEERLALAALHLSVSGTEAMCCDYRHPRSATEAADDARALAAFEKRSLTWRSLDEHSMEIRIRLPVDQGAQIVATLELFEQALLESMDEVKLSSTAAQGNGSDDGVAEPAMTPATVPSITARQRRVDALGLMASRACSTSEESASSDRCRVHLQIRIDQPASSLTDEAPSNLPALRPTLSNFGPVAPATARRFACDAGLSTTVVDSAGDPVSIGRLSRVWPAAMRRAIIARDGHCQVSGCTARHRLDVHHLVHWADGGETEMSNGVTVCRRCHVMVHEGGFRLEPATRDGIRADLIAGFGDLPAMAPDDASLDAAVRMVAAVQRFRLLPPAASARADTCGCRTPVDHH